MSPKLIVAFTYYRIILGLITERLLREQQDFIRARYPRLVNLLPVPCGCVTVNNQKCCSYSCYNCGVGVTCAPTCGQYCLNSPWDNDLFVIGKKTYLKRLEDKGHGIFANEYLPKDTPIGELTGRIRQSFFGLDAEALNYAFRYDDISLVIDSFRQGNGCSRMNTSSDPNCIARIVVDNKMLKVMIIAIKPIPKDMELTLNYFWLSHNEEYVPKFKCENEKCTRIVGYMKNTDYTLQQGK